MSDENKYNLIYFESTSMKELYNVMEEWQKAKKKRLLSTSILKDKGKFCCIALSNPSEVVIVGSMGEGATVSNGNLDVNVRKTY